VTPNYPTSDIQHLAQCLLKVRAGDQISVADAKRLETIAGVGHSHVDAATIDTFLDPNHPDATRVHGQI
jgi:hypothetical protein